MASNGTDLLAKAKKFREVDSLQHESIPNVAELLERISKFLQEHETSSTNDCTHTVFDNYLDWWMSTKPLYKLAIAEDNTVDQLHRMTAQLYDLGIPLTLTEKRSTVVRFIQDIEIWGTNDEAVTASELIDCQGAFMKLLSTTIGTIYDISMPCDENGEKFLDCVVFDATGLSKTKGIQKTSVRLVWSNIVVDRTRAGRIHDYVVHKFKDSQDPDILAFGERVSGYSKKENEWSNIFNDGIYFGRFGVRMPLCDRVSPAPLKKPENRPFKPVGIIRSHYKGGEFESLEHMCDGTMFEGKDWIKMGSIRRDAGHELTEWTCPVFVAPAKSRPQSGGGGGDRGYMQAEAGTRQPGRASFRTQGGSDDRSRPARSGPRTEGEVRQENLVTVVREFPGTMAEFRERIEKEFGGQQGDNFQEDAEKLVWTMTGGHGRIEMKAVNGWVCVSGMAHQVRSILVTLGAFVRPVGGGDGGSSVTGTARSRGPGGSRPGSEHGGASRTPSAAFAPSAVYAPSGVAQSATSMASQRSAGGSRVTEPSRRFAKMDFEPQSQCELELKVGDRVTVSHDPDQANADIHRWVHGQNLRSKESGWFPNSYTEPLRVTEETEQA